MSSKWWNSLCLYIEAITPLLFFLYCTVYTLVLFTLGNGVNSILLIVSLLGAYAVVYILKVTIRVQRRKDARIKLDHTDRAFPSGHAAAVAFLIPALTYTAPWGMPIATLVVTSVLACIVILSRLSLRAHTLGQVFTGAVIGILIPLTLICLFEYFELKQRIVDPIGFEPMTSSLQMRRSTN